MEFTRRHPPKEWEERWRREKERRRKVVEEGGEGAEEYNRQLKWIVAYNDSRMGLARAEEEGSEVGASGAGREGAEERRSEERREDDERSIHRYHCENHPTDVFDALKDFRDASVLTDLTLTTEDGVSLRVHSVVLASVSAFILERLRSRKEKQRDNEGAITWSIQTSGGVGGVALMAVVEFAYTGVVAALNRDTTAEIKAAAQQLVVPRLVDLCEKEERTKADCRKPKERTVCRKEQMRTTLRSMEQLCGDGLGCDVTLDLDGTFFHVHKVILAASCDYFRGMFTCGMKESHQTCIALPFLMAPELEALVHFSYCGVLLLTWESVFEITCTALQLQFRSALSLCLDFMREELLPSTCLDVASFAEAYGMPELLEEANDFVLRNFREVSATPKFQDLPAEKLLDFLCNDGLCVPSELAVFRGVINWIEADPVERVTQAGLLMTGVRFPLMTFREFREVRAVNLRMECFGDQEVELYGSALKEFGFGVSKSQDRCRVRRPRDVVVLVGGDQLNPDVGQRIPSREMWFVNSLRSGTGLVKEIEWRKLGEIPDRPKFRQGVAVLKGKLYVAGGCYFYTKNDMMKSAYSYDPEKDGWTRLADMQEVRSNFSLVPLEERLYAIGGDTEINTNVDSVEVYDQDNDSWSFVRPLDQPLSGYAAAVSNQVLFLSGGFNRDYVCLVSMSTYHPETGTAHLADMSRDRAGHCMEAAGGRLYVAGGVCNLRKFYTDQLACEVYDPAGDSWTAVAPLPIPHAGAASAVLEGKLYVLGGYSQDDYSESGLVHRFHPAARRWESVGKLPGAVTDIRAALLRLPRRLRQ